MSFSDNDPVYITPPTAAPPLGIVIGEKFKLLRLIAEGGVGAVYEAEDALLCRRVALKLLLPRYTKNPEAVRRFRREAQAIASIDHPNVVAILEMGQQRDGTPFIVQELLRGANLRTHLAGRGWLDVDEALQIALSITDALIAAHGKGIVHRDVKPENIVLARTASAAIIPKLVDFGVAKVRPADGADLFTKMGSLLGTAAYMSPEQARGDLVVDGHTDVWALAVVLFEMLSGRRPYEGPTDQSVVVQILTMPAPKINDVAPSVPIELSKIVASAFERERDKRPSILALRERLLAFTDGLGRPLPALCAELLHPAGSALHSSVLDPSEIEKVVELAPEEFSLDEDEDDTRPAAWSHTMILDPAPHPKMEWARERPASDPEIDRSVSLTENALRINALEDTLRHANETIRICANNDEVFGRARLMQSIAAHWLGNHFDAETYALQALQKLTPGTTGSYAALGHAAMASGHLGRTEHMESLLGHFHEPPEKISPAYLVALCRFAVQLVRAGFSDRARDFISKAADPTVSQSALEPFARAWLAIAHAELAGHEGDPMRYMEFVSASVDDFIASGDIRNASLQRSNIGNAYLQLGGYQHAERILEEALAEAEPMKLSFAAAARANLGFALARLDKLDRALSVENAALDQCIRQGNRRFESVANIYLTTIHMLRGDVKAANHTARQAISASENTPTVRAYALANLANLLLNQDHPVDGLQRAREAMDMLAALDGVEEGESLIRLVHASAVAQTGNTKESTRLITEARTRLLARARRITDYRWRDSFLRSIPENAQTLALANLWNDGGTAVR